MSWQALPLQQEPPVRRPSHLLRLRLRSTRHRERRAFHRANINQNRDHHHHPQEGHDSTPQQQEYTSPPEGTPQSSNAVRQERLIRRANCPGYTTYRYRDQIAQKQQKWNRTSEKLVEGEIKERATPLPKDADDEENTALERGKRAGASPKRKGRKGHQTSSGTKERIPSTSDRSKYGSAGKQANCRTRVTGSDLYVVRLTRSGAFGNAMPCWRCLEWCKWAGVKRIFHYTIEDMADSTVNDGVGSNPCGRKESRKGRWVCIKVNEATPESCYWTQGDGKILAGDRY